MKQLTTHKQSLQPSQTGSRTLGGVLTVVAAAALLAACNKPDDARTTGEKLDATVAQAQQKTSEMGAKVGEAGKEAAGAMKEGADTAGNKVKDAGITTAVNAKLAADSSLSALRIDVDTSNGNVVLRGTAPDAQAKDRASTLASSVGGVDAVDNQLVVAAKN